MSPSADRQIFRTIPFVIGFPAPEIVRTVAPNAPARCSSTRPEAPRPAPGVHRFAR